jgi:serine phosphatase RsbU (regulator of sigma subunit)
VRSEAIDHATPEQVVTETNRLVAQDIPENTFVSLCYAVFDAATRRIVLANAGHIVPFIRRANGSITALPVVSNLPLGILPDLHYESSAVQLAQGDSVLFLTDGLVEAFAPDGEMFGFARLEQLFSQWGDRPAEDVVSDILDAVLAWQGSDQRNDDMTALVLQLL